MPSKNEFGDAFNGNKTVSITEFRIASSVVLFLAPDNSPFLIALNVVDG